MSESSLPDLSLPDRPTNRIFTGVAGTGKTYRLQQLAQAYSETISTPQQDFLTLLVQPLNWQVVIALVMLILAEQGKQLLKVSDIVEHEIFQHKAHCQNRHKNLLNTAYNTLIQYGETQDFSQDRTEQSDQSIQKPFCKDISGFWFLRVHALTNLPELQRLAQDYRDHKHPPNRPHFTHSQNSTPATVERFCMVSFHQSYHYDEFVEGIRPQINEQGQLYYGIQKGVFLQLCEKATADPTHRYALLIDEINRANLVEVFGELMSLIEPSKRAEQPNALQVILSYSKQPFSIPPNVDIYATMNTQDPSLIAIDNAFRRRFEFIELAPDSSNLSSINDLDGNGIELAKLMDAFNDKISTQIDKNAQLGQAFFYLDGIDTLSNLHALAQRLALQILPQILHNLNQFSPPQYHTQILQDLFNPNGNNPNPFILIDFEKSTHFIHPKLLELALKESKNLNQIDNKTLKENPFLHAKTYWDFYQSS